MIRLSALNDKLHRKMVGLGIPEAVAAYVSDDRNSFPGATRKFVAAAIVQRYAEQGQGMPIEQFLASIRDELINIRDWLRFAREDTGHDLNMHLYRSYGDMLAAANAWHAKLAEGDRGHVALYRDTGPEWTMATWPDGWRMIKVSPRDAENEGNMMGHCVGGYSKEIENGDTMIFSLRDPRGEPHVTMEIKPSQKFGEWLTERVEEDSEYIARRAFPKFSPSVADDDHGSPLDRSLFDEADLPAHDYRMGVQPDPGSYAGPIEDILDEGRFISKQYEQNLAAGMPDNEAYYAAQERWAAWESFLEDAKEAERSRREKDPKELNELYFGDGDYGETTFSIDQIKGQANTAPKDEYRPYLRDFAHNYLGWNGEHHDGSTMDSDTYYLEDDDYFLDPLYENPSLYMHYGKYLSADGERRLLEHYLNEPDLWKEINEDTDLPEILLGYALKVLAENPPTEEEYFGPEDPDEDPEVWRDGNAWQAKEYIDWLRGLGTDQWKHSLQHLAHMSREKGRYGDLENLSLVPGGAQILGYMVREEEDPDVLYEILQHTRYDNSPDPNEYFDESMADVAADIGHKMFVEGDPERATLSDLTGGQMLSWAMNTPYLREDQLRRFYDNYVASARGDQALMDSTLHEQLIKSRDRERRLQLLSMLPTDSVERLKEKVLKTGRFDEEGMHQFLGLPEPPPPPKPQRFEAKAARMMVRLSILMDQHDMPSYADRITRMI
jgi:hypothetical protein